MIYMISYSWYEEYIPTLVEGPEVPDWQAFCDGLLPEAVARAIQGKVQTDHPSWVGWYSITEALVALLDEHGYTKVEPAEALYNGPIIIKTEGDGENRLAAPQLTAVLEHNAQVQRRLDERMVDVW